MVVEGSEKDGAMVALKDLVCALWMAATQQPSAVMGGPGQEPVSPSRGREGVGMKQGVGESFLPLSREQWRQSW